MNAGPLVSVCTPVYNGGKFLDKCIQGVLNQTFTDFEYVIVDNASTDQTAEIIERYRRQDSRIKVFRNESTIPVIQNFNKCIEHISPGSEWIKYALADDILFPYCIQEMLKLGEQDPLIGIVSAYRIYDFYLAFLGLPMDRQIFDGAEILKKQVMHEFHVCSGSPNSLLYRRRYFDELGGFRDGYLHADTDLAYRLLDRYKLGFVHDVLTWTGQHEGRVEVASIKAGRNITEYLDFGFRNLNNYKSIELSENELTTLADYYAKQVIELRLKRLRDLDFKLPEGMSEQIPAEVSSRYGVVLRKNWPHYLKRFVFTLTRAIFRRT
jgi:glycosyltransferase involved in cell wall biosynthesis